MSLPRQFCWTKFGGEAGEEATSILHRKERERSANDGLFLWGIGNSIRPSLLALLERTPRPTVLFTPMLSPSAERDLNPAAVCTWLRATGLDGIPFEIPEGTTVTSSQRRGSAVARHYALVCRRQSPIIHASDEGWLDDHQLRNLRTGAPVGSSQVTSVVEQVTVGRRPRYQIAFTAELAPPFQVVLTSCVVAETAS
jgi:hypothetical protein